MKILISLLAVVLFTKECDKKNTTTIIEKEAITETVSKTNQEDVMITYQAFSRASFEKISITKQSVIITYDKNLKDLKTYKCPEKEWNELIALLNAIDTKSLPDLKAPTDKRLFDGAAHASLILLQNENEITCGTFDHGFPPKDIEALVNKVLSIKEMMLKQ
jgi:hypothetical protein